MAAIAGDGPSNASNDFYLGNGSSSGYSHSPQTQASEPEGRTNRPAAKPTADLWTTDSRIYTSTSTLLKTKTFTPLTVSVYSKIGNAVSSFDHQIIHETNTFFDLIATGIPDEQELWDSQGRATLVEATLICRVMHKGTISDAAKAGLTLGAMDMGLPGVVTGSIGGGASGEFRESKSEEELKRCPVGPIPKHSKLEDIKKLCTVCQGKVLPTLKKDVQSRLKNYAFLIKSPICQVDSDCELKTLPWAYWHVGRCLLTKDGNDNYISECRNRSKIGGDCRGEGSSGRFEYPCDKGLECTLIKKGSGFLNISLKYEYNKYECRDPNRPELTKPPRGE